jgi:hypothetical protein
MDSLDKVDKTMGHLKKLARKLPKQGRIGVEELSRRYENGLDLWSGLPIGGSPHASNTCRRDSQA